MGLSGESIACVEFGGLQLDDPKEPAGDNKFPFSDVTVAV